MNISLSPEILFNIGSFPVTNTLLWSFMLSLFLIAMALLVSKNLKFIPGKLQSMAEVLIMGAYDFVRGVTGDDVKAKKIFPLVFTMFVFILTANLLVYIPGQSAISLNIGNENVPLFRAIMSDYGLVFVMTTITIVLTQVVAIIVNGPFGYIGKFINIKGIQEFFRILFKEHKFNIGVLAQGFLDFFLGLMDIVGEIAKIISLSFRLFGNIFAGEVLSAVMLFLAPFFVPLPFMFLGLLTAVVQAFVFSVLTLIFITMASEIEKEEVLEDAKI